MSNNNPNFTISAVPAIVISAMLKNNTWHESCPVAIDRLRLLNICYYDFAGVEHHDGQMIVLDSIADKVINIFTELHAIKFPIAKIKLMHEYNGDDELSMKDNNSSAFINRQITGSGKASLHSYGVAVDINPIQNPYVKPTKDGVSLSPIAGAKYLNRKNVCPGMVEPIVPIFNKYGFKWGGDWNDPIDWMHFQIDREEAEKLVAAL